MKINERGRESAEAEVAPDHFGIFPDQLFHDEEEEEGTKNCLTIIVRPFWSLAPTQNLAELKFFVIGFHKNL